MGLVLREATVGDADAIARIYSEAIAERVATFHTEPIEPIEALAMLGMTRRVPFMVAERDGEVVAFAGVAPYSDFPPYADIGEYMIYVERAARAGGVGRALLDALCAEAERRGLRKLTGKLFRSNAASVELAHRCGFRDVGVHHRHGRLDGEWKDVLIVERLLGEAAEGS